MSELIQPFPEVCAAGVEALGIGIISAKVELTGRWPWQERATSGG